MRTYAVHFENLKKPVIVRGIDREHAQDEAIYLLQKAGRVIHEITAIVLTRSSEENATDDLRDLLARVGHRDEYQLHAERFTASQKATADLLLS